MNSLTDYIRWYSDLSFYEVPFNEVDNLVLSNLSYYSFDLKKNDGKPMILRNCIKGSDNDAFFAAAKQSVRFGRMLVSDFEEVFDKKNSTQFAAMTFHLHDNLYYISFRGTDNTLVGWREDFMISYKKTSSQTLAVQYLEGVIKEGNEYYVGGHSKGGHLSMYGCCHLPDEKLSLVKHIYNNDGPGLCPEVTDITLMDRIKSRVTVILPQYCIFGRIFAMDELDTRIVSSSVKGVNQHDLITWGVKHGRLDTVKDFDPDSLWINGVTDNWIKDNSTEEREKFVTSVFDSFESRGAESREEIMKDGVEDIETLLKKMVETDTLKTAAKIPEKVLFGDFWQRLRTGKLAKLISANQLIEGIVMSVLGLLMLIFPTRAFNIIIIVILGGVVAFQFFYTLRKLYECKWNFEKERARVYIFAAIATVFAIILVKKQAIFIVGSAISGCWLLVIAYRSFLAVKKSKVRDFAYVKNIIKAIVYFICGVFIMVAPAEMIKWFMLTLGAVMTIDGLSSIVYSFIQANEKYSEKYSHLKEKVTHHSGEKDEERNKK